MLTPFFITGLPRSGTAWLANLFTTGKSICFHEPDPRDVVTAINAQPGRRVGASDPTLVRKHSQVVMLWPDARWLYVVRPIEECFASLVGFCAANGVTLNHAIARRAMEEDRVMGMQLIQDPFHVAVAEWDHVRNDAEVAGQVWRWLVPEIKFDVDRWKLLGGLNVQQDLKARVAEMSIFAPSNEAEKMNT